VSPICAAPWVDAKCHNTLCAVSANMALTGIGRWFGLGGAMQSVTAATAVAAATEGSDGEYDTEHEGSEGESDSYLNEMSAGEEEEEGTGEGDEEVLEEEEEEQREEDSAANNGACWTSPFACWTPTASR